MEKKLLTEKELCAELGVHRNSLRNWRMGGCPYTISNRTYRYDLDLVKKWLYYRDQQIGGKLRSQAIDSSHLWQDSPAGLALRAQLDELLEKLPVDLQDQFEDLTNNAIAEAFEAGYQAGYQALQKESAS